MGIFNLKNVLEMIGRGMSLGDAGKLLRDIDKENKKKQRRAMHMIRREDKIVLTLAGDNMYQVADKKGNVFFNAKDDYFIYFKNANFKANGTIDGRYLGNANDNLIDRHCKDVSFKDGVGFVTKSDKVVRTAKMVAVNNKTKVLIIIEN